MPSETKILVIDDNNDLTQIISLLLVGEGYQVKVCNDLEEGRFCLYDWKPQILLLDVNIDGEDSRSFCQKIKAENHEAIKVILMSGDESTLDYNEWTEADDCIAKPFDSNLLLQKISSYVNQKCKTQRRDENPLVT